MFSITIILLIYILIYILCIGIIRVHYFIPQYQHLERIIWFASLIKCIPNNSVTYEKGRNMVVEKGGCNLDKSTLQNYIKCLPTHYAK